MEQNNEVKATIGAVKMLVPTKVETTLTVPQLWNGLFAALFGTPHDIKEATGVEISDMYLVSTADGLKICYGKDSERKVFDDRGKIWRNMLKIGNEIFPDAQMDISIVQPNAEVETSDDNSQK